MEVLCYSALNAVMRNGIMFDFYPGLPYVVKIDTFLHRMNRSCFHEFRTTFLDIVHDIYVTNDIFLVQQLLDQQIS